MSSLTLGSLFDGSGGFPLGGLIVGIKPIWSSEIEPFPIRVTEKRLPQVKHYGNIKTLSGADLEPVDIITFGSPCQDMSIAGKREGLGGSQSNLFYEAVRIIKEMRCVTNGKYPRYAVWENVCGAFSSSKGEDFRCVLETLCKVKDDSVSIPQFEKWKSAGEIVGTGYSVAWRVLDAQYWGVPQRRRRIFLVADFGCERAGKILFESESLSGYFEKSRFAGKGTAQSAENSIGTAVTVCLNDQGGNQIDITEDMTCTLRAEAHRPPCVLNAAGFCTEHSEKSRSIGYEGEISPTIRAGTVPATVFENHSQDTRYTQLGDVAPTVSSTYGTGGNNQPFVVENVGNFDVRLTSENTKNARHNIYSTETSRTLDTGGNSPDSNQGGVAVVAVQGSMVGRTEKNGPQGSGVNENVSFTLNTTDRHAIAYGIDRAAFNQGENAQFNFAIDKEKQPTIVAKGAGAVAQPIYTSNKASFIAYCSNEVANALEVTDYKDPPIVNDCCPNYIVRRLTPTECARLQGFPSDWCNNLGYENPPIKEVLRWVEIFKEYNTALGKKFKQKTENQVRKWLKNPHSDSAEYKMWGNGVALPCVIFVLAGIVWAEQEGN